MPSTMTAITITEPASGISITIAIGRVAQTSARKTALFAGNSRSPASTWSDITSAMDSTIASLANSAGCTEKPPPSWIQECWPLMVEPSGLRVAISSRITPAYRKGTTVRNRRLPIAITTAHSAAPTMTLVRCRNRKYCGSPWVRESRPRVADQTSSELPSDRTAAASSSIQSIRQSGESLASALGTPPRCGASRSWR